MDWLCRIQMLLAKYSPHFGMIDCDKWQDSFATLCVDRGTGDRRMLKQLMSSDQLTKITMVVSLSFSLFDRSCHAPHYYLQNTLQVRRKSVSDDISRLPSPNSYVFVLSRAANPIRSWRDEQQIILVQTSSWKLIKLVLFHWFINVFWDWLWRIAKM